jgi:mono/diheme cytochrome c family protein
LKTESPRRSRWLMAAPLVWLAVTGCRQDMHDQPRYEAQEESRFFEDRRASRPLPEGAVPRGFLRQDAKFYQGKDGEQMVKEFPLPVTAALLERGQQRYNIYCSPCHGQTGDGNGMIPSRGAKHPPSYHIDRLREAPVGYFYDVITNGFGAMYDYSAQIQDPQDRWAIVAYIRVLQRSRYAPETDAPAEERNRLGPPPAKPVVPAATTGAAQ